MLKLHKTFTNNFIVIVLILILVLFLLIARYIYTSFIDLEDQNSSNKYEKINSLKFSNLPEYIQANYILKDNCPKTICPKQEPIIKTITKTEIKRVIKVDDTKILKLQKKIKNLEKKLLEKKVIKINKNISTNKDFFKNEKFKVAKCYDMPIGESYITKLCKKSIFKLLKNTKNIKYLVIIGVVDKSDLKVLNKYKSKNIKKIIQSGLAFKRVEDTIWTIRDKIKNKMKIFPSSYNVVSKYKNKGVVVRAYY